MSLIRKEITALYLIQILNFVIPLLIIPYLTNTLGIENFGKLGYFNAIVFFISFIIDFGFNMSGSKSIATAKNHNEIEKIYTNIQLFRIGIFFVLNFSIYLYSKIYNGFDFPFYLIFLGTFAYILLPNWVFIGLSKNSVLAKITLVSKLLLICPVFFLIKKPDDYLVAILLYTLSTILMGVWASIYITKDLNLYFRCKHIDLKFMIYEAKISYEIFLASFFTMGYTYLTPIILKHTVGDASVGVYSILDKVLGVLRQIYVPVNLVFYPKACKFYSENEIENLKKIVKKTLIIFGLIGVFAFTLNSILGSYILELVFPTLGSTLSGYLNIGIVTQFFVSIAIIVINFVILPAGHAKILKYFYFFGFLFYILVLYVLKNILTLGLVLYSILAVEILLTILFCLYVKKSNVLLRVS